jgi:hypothetical protein
MDLLKWKELHDKVSFQKGSKTVCWIQCYYLNVCAYVQNGQSVQLYRQEDITLEV